MQFADSQTGCCGEDLLYFTASFFFSVALQTAKLRPNLRQTPDQLKLVHFNSDLTQNQSQNELE